VITSLVEQYVMHDRYYTVFQKKTCDHIFDDKLK